MPFSKEKMRIYQKNRREAAKLAKKGTVPKDAVITEGFNPDKLGGLNKGEIKDAERQASIESDDAAKSAYQMLQDMRWVYKTSHGRRRLKKLIQGDDKQFVFMVKELMKIEAALLAAKIRKVGDENGGGNQNFFVVLKGLDTEKTVVSIDTHVDMRQIENALNPNAEKYEPEETVGSRDAPEQLMKPVETMEGENA